MKKGLESEKSDAGDGEWDSRRRKKILVVGSLGFQTAAFFISSQNPITSFPMSFVAYFFSPPQSLTLISPFPPFPFFPFPPFPLFPFPPFPPSRPPLLTNWSCFYLLLLLFIEPLACSPSSLVLSGISCAAFHEGNIFGGQFEEG